MNKVAVIDTGLSNILSIARAIEECGARPVVTVEPDDLVTATHIILPGVGAFPKAMASLASKSLVGPITEQVSAGVPFLGICLGMQLLATYGHEMEGARGLDLIRGEVTKLEPLEGERVPHVGWNQVETLQESPLFDGIDSTRDFYFVHGWALRPADESDVLATTPFAGGFVSAVARGNAFGVQFHPEKSQRVGLQLLSNFLGL